MRIVKIKTLENFWKKYPETEQSLRAWYAEAKTAQWLTPHQIKQQYRSASILNDKRVVFNIKGNSFRLIVDVEYELGFIFIIWLGTHEQYDAINASTITYQHP